MTDLRRATPFALASAAAATVEVTPRELVRISRSIEADALADPPRAVAACLQDSRFLSARTRDVYARIAAAGTRVRLHGRGMQSWLAPGVTGVPLDDDDPLVDEWVVVVPGRVVMAAADLHREGDGDDRVFRVAVSRDPEVARAAAAALGL